MPETGFYECYGVIAAAIIALAWWRDRRSRS
jgi:hypothetical protein